MTCKNEDSQAGFLLSEIAIGLVVIGALVAAGAQASQYWTRSAWNSVQALQMNEIRKALEGYVLQNQTAVDTAITSAPGGVLAISPVALRTSGYLSPSFQNVTPSGGQYGTLVRRTGSGQYESVVVAVGGTALGDSDCGDVAMKVGKSGGAGACVYSTDANNIRGLGGGIVVAKASFNSATYPIVTGAPVAVSYYSQGSLVSPYLHRYAVPGQPEATRMHTAIDMNGNALQSASSVEIGAETLQEPQAAMVNALYGGTYDANGGLLTVSSDVRLGGLGNQLVSRAVYDAGVYASGDTVPKPPCPSGSSPQIFVGLAQFSDNGTGSTISAVRGRATTASASAPWTVVLQVRTEAGWVTPTATYGRVIAFTKCS